MRRSHTRQLHRCLAIAAHDDDLGNYWGHTEITDRTAATPHVYVVDLRGPKKEQWACPCRIIFWPNTFYQFGNLLIVAPLAA
jgi:hypothetical protein